MGYRKFLAKTPVFTYRDFVAFLDHDEPRSSKARESLLRYLTKKDYLLRIRRGLYCVVPAGVDPSSCPVDPYLLVSMMTEDAVLAYHTALEFFGKSYSVHERFFYLTAHATRPFLFRSYQFRGVLFPKKLRDKHQESFAVNVAERAGVNIRVTSLERTLVDVLDRPDLGGGWEEIWRSLESVEFFDLDQVTEYALLLENSTTIAKVGFFLEQHRDSLMVDDIHLQRLREHRPRKPHYVVRGGKGSGHFMAGWNLVVPDAVFRRSWQEII